MEIALAEYTSPEVQTLARSLLRELRERYGDDSVEPEVHAADFEPPDGTFLVARLSGRAVGCGGVVRYDEETAELKRMYVAPVCRGQGVSRRLLVELEASARRLGYRAVRLETGERQPEAISLYASAGYRRIPNYGPFVDEPESVCFEKRLG